LTPAFLREILTGRPYRDALTFGRIFIRNAKFVDPVDLSNATLDRNIRLDDCTFASDVDLEFVSATSPISLNDAFVGGRLMLHDFHGTSLFLMGVTTAADVDAHDMNLSGNFRASFPPHPSYVPRLLLDRARVTGYLRVDGALSELHTENAHFTNLLLENLTLAAGAYLEDMTVSESMRVERSKFTKPDIADSGSNVDPSDKCYGAARSIDADNASLGSLLLAGDRLQGISLNRSTIGGHLVVHDSRIGFACMRDLLVNGVFEMVALNGADEIYLNGSTIERNVYVTNGAFAKLDFDDDRIGGSLVFSDIRGRGELSARDADIGGGLTIRGTAGPASLGRIFLNGITVADAVVLQKVDLDEVVAANARLHSTVTLDELHTTNDLEMNSAAIDGDLRLSDVAARAVDLGDARVARTLYLQRRHDEVIGDLSLRDTNVQTVEDRVDCNELGLAKACPNPWPAKMELEGFHFEQLGSSRARDDNLADLASREPQWWVNWLGAQRAYSPEPYDTLASVMRAAGNDDTATQIAWTRKDQDRRHSEPPKSLLMLLWDAVVGYGYNLWFALGWAIFFLAFGAFLLWKTGEGARHDPPLGITYSFDMLVPLIFLEKKHEDVQLGGPVRYYFYFHKIVGYVLATFLVAGLSVLAK
jgi:hypothetical protein